MQGSLIFLGLIVAGFVALLPLLFWATSLAFGSSGPSATVYLWVETILYAYLSLQLSVFCSFYLASERTVK